MPSPAGTPPDIVVRIIANQVAENEGWRLVIENKPGAIQTLGAAEVLKQPADGQTLLCIAMSASAAAALLPKISFRFDHDFTPVVRLATAYHVLVVNPSLPVTTLPQLVSLLKREPDKFTFSSGGFGTPAHLAGEMFKLQAGVRSTHVPYPQGLSKAIADLINGTNHFQFITPLPVLDLIANGRLRAIAVTSASRLAALPNVPTVGEQGFPDLIIQDWFGVVAKAGTSPKIIGRINEAANRALGNQHVRDALLRIASEPIGGSPLQFQQFLADEIGRWSKVVSQSSITIH